MKDSSVNGKWVQNSQIEEEKTTQNSTVKARHKHQPSARLPKKALESMEQFMKQIRPYRISLAEGKAKRHCRTPKPNGEKRRKAPPTPKIDLVQEGNIASEQTNQEEPPTNPCAELLLTEMGIEAEDDDYFVPYSSPQNLMKETKPSSSDMDVSMRGIGQAEVEVDLESVHLSRLIQEENRTLNEQESQEAEQNEYEDNSNNVEMDFQNSLPPPTRAQDIEREQPSKEQELKGLERPTEAQNLEERPTISVANESPDTKGAASSETNFKNQERQKSQQSSYCSSYLKIFKYGDCWQKLWLLFGILAAMIAGVTVPSIAILYGEIVPFFDPFQSGLQALGAPASNLIKLVVLLCAIQILFGYLQYVLLQKAAENIVSDLEGVYLKSLFAQKANFFEGNQTKTLPAELSQYLETIRVGIGEKLGQLVFTVSMFLGGLVIALWTGPVFTIICLCYMLLWIGVIAFLNYLVKQRFMEEQALTEQLGVHAREVLRAFRIVVTNSREELMIQKFEDIATKTFDQANKASSLKSMTQGFFVAFWVSFFVFCYAVGGWLIQAQAENPVTGEPYRTEEIVIVGQAIMMSCLTFMSALSAGTICTVDPAIVKSAVAGRQLLSIIDSKSQINVKPLKSHEQLTRIPLKGGIRFQDVHYRGPGATEFQPSSLQGVSFSIRAHTLTAITRASGFSEISSIGQLLARLYDPDSGSIFLSGVDLKSINMATLKDSIVYVPASPALVSGTIRDNLLLGNSNADESSMQQVLDLVTGDALSHKLDMWVSNDNSHAPSSTTLTDSQKQLLSIARALLRKPQVLIIDDSASYHGDKESQQSMKVAITRIQARVLPYTTMIVITDRAHTVRNADNVVYFEGNERVIEAKKGSEVFDKIARRLDMARNYVSASKFGKEAAESQQETGTGDRQVQTLEKWLQQDQSGKMINKNKGWGRVISYHPRSCACLMVIFAMLGALSFPLFGFVVAKIQMSLIASDYDSTWAEQLADLTQYFLALSLVMGILTGIKMLMFGTVAENLVFSIRCELFRSILSQRVRWLDGKDQELTAVLTWDVLALSGMTMETITVALEVVLSLIIAVVVATLISSQITLYAVVFSPIVLLGMFLTRFLQHRSQGNNQIQTKSAQEYHSLLTDSIQNYMTVLGLSEGSIDELIRRLQAHQEERRKERMRESHLQGLCFGYANCARMLYLGLIFWFAILEVREDEESSENIYVALWVLFSTLHGASIAIQNLTSLTKAKDKANTVFTIIDSAESHPEKQQKKKAIKVIKRGSIEFKNVTFTYPSLTTTSLNRLSMKVPVSQRVAIVDLTEPSGRETITDLLLRFYDTASGANKGVQIDGIDIADYDLEALRKQIGYISGEGGQQAPPLFNQTVMCNLLFGDTQASDEKILRTAIQTNLTPVVLDAAGSNNIEELDPVTRKEKTRMEIMKVMRRLPSATKEALQSYNELTIKQDRLLLEVLQNVDNVGLRLIDQAPEEFVSQLIEDSDVFGIRWEDIVLNFEWLFELDRITRSDQFNLGTKQAIESATLTHRYLFDFRMVLKWSETLEQQPLEDFIQLHQHVCAQSRSQRLSQLNAAMVNSYRNEAGKVMLGSGFERSCGHKGRNLTASQRQRVAIARVLLKDPKILIYEEDTSSTLDEASQELVQQALERAMEGRTSIVLATRLRTISKCDHVYVMKRGQIVESGTYEQLVTDSESYFCRLKNQLAS